MELDQAIAEILPYIIFSTNLRNNVGRICLVSVNGEKKYRLAQDQEDGFKGKEHYRSEEIYQSYNFMKKIKMALYKYKDGSYYYGDLEELGKVIDKTIEKYKNLSDLLINADYLKQIEKNIAELYPELEALEKRYKTKVNKLAYDVFRQGIFYEIRKEMTREDMIKALSLRESCEK